MLAGTILMGSGITGSGPDCHDSSVTLSTLLPHIANYRDAFYDELLERLSGRMVSGCQRSARCFVSRSAPPGNT